MIMEKQRESVWLLITDWITAVMMRYMSIINKETQTYSAYSGRYVPDPGRLHYCSFLLCV